MKLTTFLFELMAFACLTGERAFLHGTRCEFEMIQFAINARGTVEYEFFISMRISLKLVRLQFDLNSTNDFQYVCFLERFLAETGDPREVECLV